MLQEAHDRCDGRSGRGEATPWFAGCLLAPSYLTGLPIYESFIMIYLMTPPQIPSYISTSVHELNVKGICIQPAEGWGDGSIDKVLVPNMRI